MATSYTSLLGLALPVTGELSGTWGDTVNNSITSLLDTAIAGTTTVSADTTLTTTDGASNQARSAIIIASGHVANITITAPARSKIYTVINASGTYTVTFRGVGPTTGVTLGVNEKAQLAWNGSDFVRIGGSGGAGVFSSITNSSLTSGRVVYSTTGGLETDSANLTFNGTTLTANTLNLTNALGTASGGTGLTSFTSGGVVYASSSSALSTGSALTFDGNGISVGTGAAQSVNTINGGTTGGAIKGQRAGVNQWFVGDTAAALGSGTGLINFVYNNDPFIWSYAGTDLMRLTSTGLGIGTSSPGYKLTVAGGATSLAANQYLRFGAALFAAGDGSVTNYLFSGTTSMTWRNAADSADLMYLSNGGNLGLGVTPSAWGSAYKATQLTYGSLYSAAFTVLGLSVGAYNDNTNWRYIQSGQLVGRYEQSAGQHQWFTAPSGTVGTAITFTQAMTLDASGNLLVGTTSITGARAVIVGSASSSSRVGIIRSTASGDTTYSSLLVSKFDNNSTTSQVYVQFSMNNDGTASGQINANGANQAAFGSWSDRRLKENIVDLSPQLSNILALRPVEFDYIESEGGGHQTGFIAQEMESIYPDAVGERHDGMKTITGWSKTEARLVKAIQELKAEVDSLKAQLESK